MIDLQAAGLSDWQNPLTAGAADAASQQRLMAGLISLRLELMRQYDEAESRMAERKLERQLDEAHKTGVLLAALLKAGAVS